MRNLYLIFFTLTLSLTALVSRAQNPVFTIQNIKDACDGLANGSVDVVVTSAVGNITILVFGPPNFSETLFSPGTVTFENLPVRTGYLVIVQDDNGSAFQTFDIVNVPNDLQASFLNLSNNSTCVTPDGFINIDVSDGTGSYSFQWTADNGFTATTQNISGLNGGNYSVTVFDEGSNCFRDLGPFTITDPQPNLQNITSPSPLFVCIGDDAIITLGGSEQDVVYEIYVNGNPSGITQIGPAGGGVINLTLTSGSFTTGDVITVEASLLNCTPILMNGSVTIEIQDLQATADITNNTRCEAPFDGAISLNITGAIGTLDIVWSGPTAVADGTVNATGLQNGSYNVVITDQASNCEWIDDYVVGDARPLFTIDLDGITNNTRCEAPFNGVINISISGAPGPFDFSWTGPGGFTNSNQSISGLEAGIYEVTVTDPVSGCEAIETYEVEEDAATLVVNIDNLEHNTRCIAPFNGVIDISITGDPGPFDFSWTGPGGFTSTSQNIATLEPGIYEVNVTNPVTGCTVDETIEIEDNAETLTLTVDNVDDNTRCIAPFNGAIDISIGGSAGPFDFSWTGPGGFTSTSQNIANLEPGTYEVTATIPVSGCFVSETIIVAEDAEVLTLTVDNVINNTRCVAPFNGAIDISIGGSAGPFDFAWTGPGGFTSNSQNITALAPGTYEVTATNPVTSCQVAETIIVADDADVLTLTVDNVIHNTRCIAPFDGAIDISIGGSAGPFDFSWTGPGGFTSNSQNLTVLEPGIYQVTATDPITGCFVSESIEVEDNSENLVLTVVNIDHNTRCTAPFNGSIEISVAGNTGSLDFSWTGPGGFTSTSQNITVLGPGSYQVTAVNSVSGCEVVENIVVNDNANPIVITPVLVEDNIRCDPPFNGAIQINVSGGAGPLNFSWAGPGGFTASTQNISNLEPGTYTVVVNEPISGCEETEVFTINDNSAPITITLDNTEDNTSCGAPNGAIEVSVAGSPGPFNFSWTGPGGFTASTQNISGLSGGTYDLVVADANSGCSDALSVVIDDLVPLVTVTIDNITPNTECQPPFTGAVTITPGGTSGPFSFSWTGPGGFTASTQNIQDVDGGTYEVTVTDDVLGCDIMETVVVPQATPPIVITVVNVAGNDACLTPFNGSISVEASGTGGPYTFAWTGPGGFSSSVTGVTSDLIDDLNFGDYDLTVTDQGTGCTEVLTVAVPDLTPTFSIDFSNILPNQECQAPYTGAVTAEASGTAGPYTYSWTGPGGFTSSDEDIDQLFHGTYQVEVTDQSIGCTQVATVAITDDTGGCGPTGDCSTVIITPSSTPALCTNSDGTITFNVDPPVPSVNNTGVIIEIAGPVSRTNVNDFFFDNLPFGLYNYTVQYGDPSCIINGLVTVEQTGTVGTPIATNPVNVTCFGEETGAVTVDVSGQTGNPLEWSIDGVVWNTFISGNQITGLPAGPAPDFELVISVRQSSADACFAALVVIIEHEFPQIQATIEVEDQATCNNNDGSIRLTALTGGNDSSYTFEINGNAATPDGSNVFAGVPGGNGVLTVIDASGCSRDFNYFLPGPGIIGFSLSGTDPTCAGGAVDGTVTMTIDPAFLPGNYEVAISTVQGGGTEFFTVPASGVYQFSDLSNGRYYVAVQSNEGCPNEQSIDILDGPDAVDFEPEIVCINDNPALRLNNISGEPGSAMIIEVFRVGEAGAIQTVNLTDIPAGNVFMFTNVPFLTQPGDYLVRIRQAQVACGGSTISSPQRPFSISTPLSAAAIASTSSFPDIPNGTMTIGSFTGGVPPYVIRIELDSAAFGQSYSTDWDSVRLNSNFVFEYAFSDMPAGRYLIEVMDAAGCVLEIVGRVERNTDLFIPNVFTPNNDGINDTFQIRNLPDSGSRLLITNRWGKEVFSSSNYQNNWDGDGIADGVYFYKLVISDESFTGWVEIMRGNRP